MNLRKSLLAAACALAMAGTATATTFNESIEGDWTDLAPLGQNKGVLFDYVDDEGLLFFAFFTYDEAGEQIWLVGAFPVTDGVAQYNDVPALRYTGGDFSSGGAPVPFEEGTIDWNLQCDSVQVAFSPNTGSALQAVTLNMVPALGLESRSGQCAPVLSSCPTGTTAVGNDCRLPNSIAGNLHLPAGKKYLIQGQVNVESGGVLTIAPGVTVQGAPDQSSPNFLAVLRGGRIYAEGTAELPITFTGPTPVPGSWSGLVLAGNSICNDAVGSQLCQFEAVPSITYGGNDLDDSSGALRYVRIQWGGFAVAPNEELNSLTLMGVGSGTVLEYVQVDGGLDDGFEFFGGTVNGRYLVCSNMGDDCFDFDQGYAGKIQFGLGWQGTNPDQNNDSHGVESDNDSSDNDKSPRTRPTIANLTMIGGPVGNEGMRIRRGSGGNYFNVVVSGYQNTCLNLNDAGTFALGTGSAQGEALTITHSFMGQCAAGTFEDEATDPYAVSDWYNAGTGNDSGNPMLRPNHFLPTAGSPVLSGGAVPSDPWFMPTPYRGAFANEFAGNWTAGWTVNLPD